LLSRGNKGWKKDVSHFDGWVINIQSPLSSLTTSSYIHINDEPEGNSYRPTAKQLKA
jgi:hypothetical protein